jgi:dihydropteroate synthase
MDVLSKKKSLCIRGVLYDLSEPLIMGILNVSTDSFFDGGKYSDKDKLVARIRQMRDDGADIIDVGGVSTRPGAGNVSESDEMRRLLPVMEMIRDFFPDSVISIDTTRSSVARKMVSEYGAAMINDISSGNSDKKMLDTLADLKVPYIAMHMQGTPRTMQLDPRYDDVVNDIIRFFAEKIRVMRSRGIADIIADPGFGFGKTVDHNYIIASRLEEFGILDIPVLAGFSRKSMICRLLKVNPEKALTGTIVLNAVAVLKGVDILRVHDVSEARDTIRVISKLKKMHLEGDYPVT